MAIKVSMTHPATGINADGYFGFSWSSFFFSGIPAIARGDAVTGAAVLLTSIVLSLMTFGLLWFAVTTVWAAIYNKRYTLTLVEKGYVFDDDPTLVFQAKAALGIKQNCTHCGSILGSGVRICRACDARTGPAATQPLRQPPMWISNASRIGLKIRDFIALLVWAFFRGIMWLFIIGGFILVVSIWIARNH